MNMAELHLNDEETSAFVTLWEQFPQLWNPQDKKYKNREARNLALRQIADLFSKNWTKDEVYRKIESLKSYYRKQKKKYTGSPEGQVKWAFFDRIASFYGGTLYVPDGAVISSECSGDVEQVEVSQSDLHKLMLQLQNQLKSTESCQSSTTQIKGSPSPLKFVENGPEELNFAETPKGPPLKKARKILAERCTPSPIDRRQEFQETAISILKDMRDSSRKEEYPNMTYAITVADRLDVLKSRKTVFQLKHKIDNLLHEAIMEEMSD